MLRPQGTEPHPLHPPVAPVGHPAVRRADPSWTPTRPRPEARVPRVRPGTAPARPSHPGSPADRS